MKQKVLAMALTLVMVLSLLPMSALAADAPDQATSGTCGDGVYWSLNDGTLTISGNGNMNSYYIGDLSPWRINAEEIRTVRIESGVTSIGSFAFYRCHNLKDVRIDNNSIHTIEHNAFDECISLNKIALPDGLTTIGPNIFNGCTNLQSIMIPKTVTQFGYEYDLDIDGDRVFSGCNKLTEINVDAENTNYCDIDGVLFTKDGTSLVEYPAGKLEATYTIPKNVVEICKFAFDNCYNLTDIEVTGNPLYCSIDGVLFNKDASTLIRYPAGKLSEEYTVPDGVTTLRNSFSTTKSLTRVNIPASVICIKNGTFDRCDTLADVYYAGSLDQWEKIDNQQEGESNHFGIDYDVMMHYAKGAYSNPVAEISGTCGDNLTWTFNDGKLVISGTGTMTDYISSYDEVNVPWPSDKVLELVIEPGIKNIGTCAFEQCFNLAQAIIPDSVTEIGTSAFSQCCRLSGVTLPDKLSFIGDWAFSHCFSLSEITIPGGVKNIGDSSFYYCYNIKTITISEGVERIEDTAFDRICNLRDVYLPSTIKYIGSNGINSVDNITTNEAYDEQGPFNIYYNGTEEEWNAIQIDKNNVFNHKIVKIHYKQDILDQESAEAVDAKIAKIGKVTLASDAAIKDARVSYDALNDNAKKLVKNLEVLEAAEKALAELKGQDVVDQEAAEAVDAKIAAIGTVSLNSEAAIQDARTAYNKLNDNAKKLVTKLDTLTAAEKTLADLKAEADQAAKDQAAAAAVDAMIDSIGEVTLEDEATIKEARKSYEALTDTQKALVQNLNVLVFAENALADLQAQAQKLPFVDVKEKDWFYPSVQYVYNHGMMTGVSDTEFKPNNSTTRAQIVTILYRLEDEPEFKPCSFKDVAPNHWFYQEVSWASANGIVTGYPDGTFAPNKPISREQMAAILYRYAKYKGYDMTADADMSKFVDAGQINNYAAEPMRWAVSQGIMNGVGGNRIAPKGQATRAQIATLFMKFDQHFNSVDA